MDRNSFFYSIKEEMNWKKIVAILIILTTLTFLFFNVSLFKRPAEYPIAKKVVKDDGEEDPTKVKYLDFMGSKSISRDFTAKEPELQRVSVGFLNTKLKETKGSVTVSIIDPNGKTVASSKMAASDILSVDNTVFDMVTGQSESLNKGDITDKSTDHDIRTISLVKGQTYTLLVEGKDIYNTDRFKVKVVRNGRPSTLEDGDLFFIVKYFHKQTRRIGLIVIMILIALAIVSCPMEHLSRTISRRVGRDIDCTKWLTRLMFVMTPFVGMMINFVIMDKNLMWIKTAFDTPRGILNLAVVALVWFVLYAVINRTKWASIITTILWLAFAFANYLLLQFRSIPLMPSDFASFGTAMDVAGGYEVVITSAAVCSFALAAVWVAILFILRGYRGLAVRKRLIVMLAACMSIFGVYYLFFESTYINDNGIIVGEFRPRNSYDANGYPLAFAISVSKLKMEKPEGYSIDKVREIAKEYPSDKADDMTEVSKNRPNVIVVMNESLADLSELTPIDTENDFMPFIRGLKKNTVRGTLHVSVFGGSTANSEYEFLTGNSTVTFPENSVPFNSKLKEDTPSFAKVMKQLGYGGNVAFHPGMRDSYNRNNAYKYLGFDKHIALDDLKDPEMVRSFVSDSYDYKTVEQEYEDFRKQNEKQPFFMFNVTIQNHGSYALKTGIVDDTVKIKDPELDTNLVRQYLNLIKISDDAFKELIEYFEKVKEPTAIVIYGDHQPSLGDDFTALVDSRSGDKDITSVEHTEKRYHTPFIIWTNYDMEEKEGIQISDNYLGAYVMKTLGLPMTGYDKFLLDLSEEVPFYSAIGYSDKEGKVYGPQDESGCSSLINRYQILQYNNIVDRNNREAEFFKLAE